MIFLLLFDPTMLMQGMPMLYLFYICIPCPGLNALLVMFCHAITVIRKYHAHMCNTQSKTSSSTPALPYFRNPDT